MVSVRQWPSGGKIPTSEPLSVLPQHPAKQYGIHSAAEANLAINLDDRNTRIEPLPQRRIVIDIDHFGFEAKLVEQRLGIVAKMATLA
jgi:hypothetical protein